MRRIVTLGAALLTIGCGILDNTDIRGLLAAETTTTVSCAPEHPLLAAEHVLPIATAGRAWAGWLHVHGGPARWQLSGLPEGLVLGDDSGFIHGHPVSAGVYVVTATATHTDCSTSRLTAEVEILVEEPCGGEVEGAPPCSPVPACTDAHRDRVTAYVHSYPLVSRPGAVASVGPGETYAADGLTVMEANGLRDPRTSPDTGRRMILAVPGSKDPVIIHFTVPGGVYVPIEGDVVDLRYIRGHHDDHYLFLTAGQHSRFVVYDGFLPPEEIAARCPQNLVGDRCPMPNFAFVPMNCPRDFTCAPHVGAMELLADASDPTDPSKSLRQLAPGAVARSSGQLIRVVDAWERSSDSACSLEDPPRYFGFYQIPIAACSVAEAHAVYLDPSPAAPMVVIADARVLFPTAPELVACNWTFDAPDVDAAVAKGSTTATDMWLEMAAAGLYHTRVTCRVVADGKEYQPCNHRPADLLLLAETQLPYRIELLWPPSPSGDGLQLRIGVIGAERQGHRVFALDLEPPPGQAEVVVTYEPPPGSLPVPAVVRVLHEGVVVGREATVLQAGQSWQVGTLGPAGFARMGVRP